jgi:preprotein translocase subunit Sec63
LITIVGLAAPLKGERMDVEHDGQQDVFSARGINTVAGWLVISVLAFTAVLWLL